MRGVVECGTDDMVIDGIGGNTGGTFTPDAGQDDRVNVVSGNARIRTSTKSGGDAVTMGWTITGGENRRVQIAIPVLASGPGGLLGRPRRGMAGVG